MKITSRYDSAITLYESDTATTLRELLVSAVRDKANLGGANLGGANLTGANLTGANLTGAYIAGANLIEADLTGANLRGADLAGANLTWADLTWADLARANFTGANFTGADLSDVKNMPPTSILPEGTIVGWKKLQNGVICKLQIPAKARRVNSTGRKCRCEYAKVLWLSEGVSAIGSYDCKTVYEIGKIVTPDSYDPDFRTECSHGIHFFITREEAERY